MTYQKIENKLLFDKVINQRQKRKKIRLLHIDRYCNRVACLIDKYGLVSCLFVLRKEASRWLTVPKSKLAEDHKYIYR